MLSEFMPRKNEVGLELWSNAVHTFVLTASLLCSFHQLNTAGFFTLFLLAWALILPSNLLQGDVCLGDVQERVELNIDDVSIIQYMHCIMS